MKKRWWAFIFYMSLIFISGCFMGSHLTNRQHLAQGLNDYKKENYKGARKHLKVAVETLRDSVMLPKALYFYGESLFKTRKYNEATQYFNRLVYSFPRDSLAELSRLKVNACYRAQFHEALKRYNDEDYLDARNDFKVIILSSGLASIQDSARFYYANCYYHTKEYMMAIAEFERLVKFYPRSFMLANARFQIAMCYYKLAPKYSLDQEYTHKARSEFQQFIDEFSSRSLYPNTDKKLLEEATKRLFELKNRLARKTYEVGRLYRRMGEFDAAVIALDQVLKEYHDTDYAPKAQYWKAECLRRLNRPDEARSEFEKFLKKYPEHKDISKVNDKLKEIAESGMDEK